jgi:Immunity protein 8
MDAVLRGLEFDPDPRLLPEDAAQMMSVVTVTVGPSESKGGDLFTAKLCTPEWIASRPETASVLSGYGYLIVGFEDFNEQAFRRGIETFLARISEETWIEVARRVMQWFPDWEYEGYAP